MPLVVPWTGVATTVPATCDVGNTIPLPVIPLDRMVASGAGTGIAAPDPVMTDTLPEGTPECLYHGRTADGNVLFIYAATNALYHERHSLPFVAPSQPYEDKWRRGYLVFLPVAFAFDVATCPIQAIVAVAEAVHQFTHFQLP